MTEADQLTDPDDDALDAPADATEPTNADASEPTLKVPAIADPLPSDPTEPALTGFNPFTDAADFRASDDDFR